MRAWGRRAMCGTVVALLLVLALPAAAQDRDTSWDVAELVATDTTDYPTVGLTVAVDPVAAERLDSPQATVRVDGELVPAAANRILAGEQRVMLVLDTAGGVGAGMGDARLRTVQAAAVEFLLQVDPAVEVGVTAGSTAGATVAPTTDRTTPINAIAALETSGGATVATAILDGLRHLQVGPDAGRNLVVLSSGDSDFGGDLDQVQQELTGAGVALFVVMLPGTGDPDARLQPLLRQVNGQLFQPDAAAGHIGSLDEIAARLTSQYQVRFTATLGDGESAQVRLGTGDASVALTEPIPLPVGQGADGVPDPAGTSRASEGADEGQGLQDRVPPSENAAADEEDAAAGVPGTAGEDTAAGAQDVAVDGQDTAADAGTASAFPVWPVTVALGGVFLLVALFLTRGSVVAGLGAAGGPARVVARLPATVARGTGPRLRMGAGRLRHAVSRAVNTLAAAVADLRSRRQPGELRSRGDGQPSKESAPQPPPSGQGPPLGQRLRVNVPAGARAAAASLPFRRHFVPDGDPEVVLDLPALQTSTALVDGAVDDRVDDRTPADIRALGELLANGVQAGPVSPLSLAAAAEGSGTGTLAAELAREWYESGDLPDALRTLAHRRRPALATMARAIDVHDEMGGNLADLLSVAAGMGGERGLSSRMHGFMLRRTRLIMLGLACLPLIALLVGARWPIAALGQPIAPIAGAALVLTLTVLGGLWTRRLLPSAAPQDQDLLDALEWLTLYGYAGANKGEAVTRTAKRVRGDAATDLLRSLGESKREARHLRDEPVPVSMAPFVRDLLEGTSWHESVGPAARAAVAHINALHAQVAGWKARAFRSALVWPALTCFLPAVVVGTLS